MGEVTDRFIQDPSLLWGMVIAIITLVGALAWLMRWILNKLITVAENNTAAMNRVSATSEDLQQSIQDLHKTMNEFLIKIVSK